MTLQQISRASRTKSHTGSSSKFTLTLTFVLLGGKPISGGDASWFHGQSVRTVLEPKKPVDRVCRFEVRRTKHLYMRTR